MIYFFCAEIKEKNPHFGSSLLLANIGANSHMSPKIVNGSFAALFDNNDVNVDFSKKLQQLKQDTKDSGIKLLSIQNQYRFLNSLWISFKQCLFWIIIDLGIVIIQC